MSNETDLVPNAFSIRARQHAPDAFTHATLYLTIPGSHYQETADAPPFTRLRSDAAQAIERVLALATQLVEELLALKIYTPTTITYYDLQSVQVVSQVEEKRRAALAALSELEELGTDWHICKEEDLDVAGSCIPCAVVRAIDALAQAIPVRIEKPPVS